MSEEIIKVLDDLAQRFGIAIDWTSANVLPYLQELGTRFISFKNAQAIIWMVISVLVTIGCSIFCVKLNKWRKANKIDAYDDEFIGCAFAWTFAGMAILGFVIAFFCNMNGLMQNIFMPELTILEYLQTMGG